MAGIGFGLRHLLNRDSYTTTLQAYLYAGMISAGPWVLSIISVLLIGVISLHYHQDSRDLTYFLVTVTYMMSSSLILTGGLQLLLTRFVADRLYAQQADRVLPNTFGALLVTTLIVGMGAAMAVTVLFADQSLFFRVLVALALVVLNNLWLVVMLLSGMKAYHRILAIMFVGYTMMVLLSVVLQPLGIEGLMLAFAVGHSFLLFAFLYDVIREYPAKIVLAFDFLKRRNVYLSLFFTGLAYYLGIWSDKILFWFNPATSDATAGLLRSSMIYDIPIFLAYLTIIPGMAVFLVRFETDFAEHYRRFYDAIRDNDALDRIVYLKGKMVDAIRQGIFEILKVQTLTVILLLLWAKPLLEGLGISPFYEHLLQVDMVGVGVQVVMMAIMNVLFYLDRRAAVLGLSLLFLGSNVLLTGLSQQLDPAFFGYGFVAAATLTSVAGLLVVDRILPALEYETFMLRN